MGSSDISRQTQAYGHWYRALFPLVEFPQVRKLWYLDCDNSNNNNNQDDIYGAVVIA